MLFDWSLSGIGCCTYPCWLWPTYGGSQPTPMVEDMYYDVILRILGIMGNVGCLEQWC